MSLDERPVLLTVAAAAVVAAGTLVTTFIPLFRPATQPSAPWVVPYTPIEVEGRDIYIREGCNNCHTQTVRPLGPEVARYGEYSKAQESAYDRPFLWGSRRIGPDLARVGGKYPDAWHYRHMADPRAMFPPSNMPSYGWLAGRSLDVSRTAAKVRVLGLGTDDPDAVASRLEAFRRSASSPSRAASAERNRTTPERLRDTLTEMDALVAYLQKPGADVKALARKEHPPPAAVAASNPFAGDRAAAAEGERIFRENCRACHGEHGEGLVGPSLRGPSWRYGGTDADLFATISGGRPGGMPPFAATLGEQRIWKTIAHVRTFAGREGRDGD